MMNEFESKLEKLTRLTKATSEAIWRMNCSARWRIQRSRRGGISARFSNWKSMAVRRISCRTMSRNTARWRSPVTAGRTFV